MDCIRILERLIRGLNIIYNKTPNEHDAMMQQIGGRMKMEFYIANQNGSNFDEIQRMAIAYMNRQPVALEGKPGVGKNEAINMLARALGKKVYRVRCTEETMARDIIGGEKLAAERVGEGVATKTEFSPGKLYQAMRDGEIAVLDEINQLPMTVQKALNSVLEEGRTISDLEGNVDELAAVDGFGLFLTYNPETGIANLDLETAVRDRCKLIYFSELPAELRLRMALLKTGLFDAKEVMKGMQARGLYWYQGAVKFAEHRDGRWRAFLKDHEIKSEVAPYLYFDSSREQKLEFEDQGKHEIYTVGKAIVRSLDALENLKSRGTREVSRKYGLELDEVGRLNINKPSPRITIKLIRDYKLMRDQGYNVGHILGDLQRSIVDYTVMAGERELSIGRDLTIADLIGNVCAFNGLMNKSNITELKEKAKEESKRNIVRELEKSGIDERIAIEWAEVYTQ
ncbi:MoxR family ATPase [Candidatus Woesearchaeota archaeon]|nr:MoxR family ATPase [Candidatus Woesearchaeota archaeon]